VSDQVSMSSGRAASTADLTPEVYLGNASIEILSIRTARPELIEAKEADSGRGKRLLPALWGSKTVSVASPSHSIRVPMHHTRVPRG
jgi:hypothetical protein